ncbi:TPA: DUF4254 domain-containing protein [Legionella pneumophila]|uniref:DUF4254 domain-containing protein n=2 Tax=Legionella pneumophila TaxID=446 RepID=A0A2S6F9F2_LEGPN|nr:DUF4254 domain-containing protein [Legionella pneumophila]APF01924.1 hypothetical protein BIZ52_00465 [Legionella pneumophila subsp. fraseri]APF04934.1 hypothetical protein BIZ51_00465 [Legionella pneumophila subsp. fraseri]AUB67405.1 hypothetical protein BJK09_00470 [Legionella pneumophila]AUB70378.1 hypothetical protein BJK08_00470 [Legionella pneumophila]KXB25093.1 hypothetical protein PtVF66_09820 [Legionella pneumophila]
MQEHFDTSTITNLHKTSIIHWKTNGIEYQHKQFLQLVEENHAFNFQLWHAEDKARRDDMGFEFVYQAKREIDAYNQQRNNRMEAMDEWLYKALEPENHTNCPVNSESPGMIIDRLSILSLKSYHMDLQTKRQDVSIEHKMACAQKLEIIQQQLNQLALCLDELLNEVRAKTRTFRVYHQFKMYNDPKLNPELYCSD